MVDMRAASIAATMRAPNKGISRLAAIKGRIWSASFFYSYSYLIDSPGELFRPFLVLGPFSVFDIRPLAVSGHCLVFSLLSLVESRKSKVESRKSKVESRKFN